MKILSLFLLINLIAPPVRAGEWAVTDDGCRVWNKLPQSDEKAIWEGQCINGFAEGRGKLIWIDQNNQSEIHEGVWVAGKLNGFALSAFPGGDKYAGGYLDGEREGWGVLTWRNGSKYIGRLRNGYPDGIGVKKNAAGRSIEEGLWEKGKLIRKQKLELKDFKV